MMSNRKAIKLIEGTPLFRQEADKTCHSDLCNALMMGAHALEEQDRHKWKSVKENPPGTEQRVIAQNSSGLMMIGTVSKSYEEYGYVCQSGHNIIIDVVAWCEPPKEYNMPEGERSITNAEKLDRSSINEKAEIIRQMISNESMWLYDDEGNVLLYPIKKWLEKEV